MVGTRGIAQWAKRSWSTVSSPSPLQAISRWRFSTGHILEGSVVQTVLMILVVFGFHHLTFLCPNQTWLPIGDDVNSFLKALWQVHATVLALSAVVVTVIVTAMANERERAQTWALYLAKARVKFIVRFNLVLLGSEGLAVIQTFNVDAPLIVVRSTQNIIFAEGLFFACALVMLGYLYMATFLFLDPEYVESFAEQRITEAMPLAIRADLERQQLRRRRLTGDEEHGT